MSAHLLAVLLAAVGCGLAGLAVPALVRSVPEPPPAEDADPDAPVKETYAAIAALPGLAWRSALVAAASGALVAVAAGATWHLLVLLPLVPVGVALGVVDWRTHLLPKRLVVPSYALVVVLVLAAWAASGDVADLRRAALGWLVAGGVFFVLWFIHPAGLGYGDVRLAGVLGIALGHVGWAELFVGLYAGFLVGGLGGLVLRRVSERRRTEYPFGPFMLLGVLVGLLLGPLAAGWRG